MQSLLPVKKNLPEATIIENRVVPSNHYANDNYERLG